MFGVYTRFSKSQVESTLTITLILWAFQLFRWKSLWKRLWISCGRNVDDLAVVNRRDDARLWKSKTRFRCRLWITSQKAHEKNFNCVFSSKIRRRFRRLGRKWTARSQDIYIGMVRSQRTIRAACPGRPNPNRTLK